MGQAKKAEAHGVAAPEGKILGWVGVGLFVAGVLVFVAYLLIIMAFIGGVPDNGRVSA
jgi:hypothetical protein